MVASFSKFYGEAWVGFCLNIRKNKANRKTIDSSKKGY